MVTENIAPGSTAERPTLKDLGLAFAGWPLSVKLYLLALVVLYFPVLQDAWEIWFRDENQAHGVFIIPVSLYLLWIQRETLARTPKNPTGWGLLPLSLGLLLLAFTTLLRVQTLSFNIWSLLLVLGGSVLLLHGRNLWRAVAFPVLFLFMAGGIPGKLVVTLSFKLQTICATAAVWLMQTLGYAVLQTGNIIEIPGHQLEVAEACSGIKKLVALLAFSLIYGYLFRIGPAKRVVLFLATIPIALFANIIRVAGLIAVTQWGGEKALHTAHDWAEICVLAIAFFLFVGFGKLIGCKTLRFSL